MKYKKALKEYFKRKCNFCNGTGNCEDCDEITATLYDSKKTKICPDCESVLMKNKKTFLSKMFFCQNCNMFYKPSYVKAFWGGWDSRNNG